MPRKTPSMVSVGREHLVLVQTGLRHHGWMRPIQVGNRQVNPRRGLGEIRNHVGPLGFGDHLARHPVENGDVNRLAHDPPITLLSITAGSSIRYLYRAVAGS